MSDRLDGPPMVVAASRRKLLGWQVAAVAMSTWALGITLTEPCVCRIATTALIAPPLIGGTPVILCAMVAAPRLTLSHDGLIYKSLWQTALWSWDEVRDVRVQRV